MMKNNRGFSYVELILVLAIMAIATGLISLSIGLVGRTNVSKGADKLYSSFEQARASAMGKPDTVLELSCVEGTYYCYVGSASASATDKEEARKEIVTSPVEIKYVLSGTPDSMATLQSGTIVFKYDQATGAFKKSPTLGDYCDQIVITNGNTMATIKMYPATGKIELVY